MIKYVAALLLFFISHAVVAHHSVSSQFDYDASIEMTGTVLEYKLVNPHSTILIEVEDEQGQTETWTVHTTSALKLTRIWGWDENTLEPGDLVWVKGKPGRDLARTVYIDRIEVVDGPVLIDQFVP